MDRQQRSSFPSRLVILAGLLGVMYLMGRHYVVSHIDLYESVARAELSAIGELKARRLLDWRAERLADARALAENRILAQSLIRWLNAQPGGPEADTIQLTLQALAGQEEYLAVLLTDAGGAIRMGVGDVPPALETEWRTALRSALETGSPVLTDIHVGRHEGRPHLAVVSPLLDERGGAGALLLLMDAERRLYPLVRSRFQRKSAAESDLVRREADQATYLTPRGEGGLARAIDLGRTRHPAVQAVMGRTGIVDGVGDRGEPVLASIQPIPDTPWLLVTRVDQGDLLAGTRSHLWELAVLMLAALALLVMMFHSARERRRYLQSRSELHAESERRRSEQRFHALFDQMPEPVWIIRDGHFVEANPAALAAIGQPPGSMDHLRLHPADLSPEHQPDGEPSRAKAERMMAIVMEQGMHRFDWLYRRLDGGELPVEVTLTRLLWEDRPAVCCIWRDISERLRMLERLRASEARFRAIYESTSDAILLMSTRGLIDGNPRALALFGIADRAALETLSPVDLSAPVQPDGRPAAAAVEDYWRMAVDQGRCLFEWLSRRVDGAEFPSEVLLSAFELAGETIVQATVRDITERKRAERAVRELNERLEEKVEARTRALGQAEERLRLALEATSDGLWDWDFQTGRIYCSPGYFRMLHYGPDELEPEAGARWIDLLHPEEREQVVRVAMETLRAEGHFQLEFRMRTREGDYRWILSRGNLADRTAEGLPRRALGTHQDITERKLAQLALEDSERRARQERQRLADVIWGTHIGTWEWDIAAARVRLNERWADMIGYTLNDFGPGPVTPEAWVRHGHPDDLPRANDALDRCLRRERDFYECEWRQRHRQGHWIWVLDRGRVVEWSVEGKPLRMSGTRQDITARWRADQQIRELNASLERKVEERTLQLAIASRAKSEFLANMSHEIRTPMNAILGLAQLLGRGELSADQRGLLARIGEAGEALLRIINDIIDISKIEAGEFHLERQSFDLAVVLRRLENLLTDAAREKGLRLVVQAPPEAPGRLLGDPLRLGQILLNLAGNAVKFTRRGGVEVATRILDSSEDSVHLRFEIRDTGIGIGEGMLETLFRPFTQADASTTRRFGGTGLGLSISKRLVEMMGGRIGASSEEGKGSVFWFEIRLPHARDRQESASTPAAPETPSGPRLTGLRVLVVDDNRVNQFMLERILQEEGARVTLCPDGQQAIQYLAANPGGCDVVLMDIQMPVMDGITATRHLRARPETAALPVLALTAGVLAEEREEALRAGMNEFLTKPIDMRRLVAALGPYRPAGAGRPEQPPALLDVPATPAGRARGVPDIPGISRERVELYYRDRPEDFIRLLALFAEEFADLPAAVRRELARDDRDSALRRLHNLKGNAGNLGALGLMDAAREAETALREGRDDAGRRLESLAGELTALLEACRPWLSAPAPGPAGGEAVPLDPARLDELCAALGRHDLQALKLLENLRPALDAALDAGTSAAIAEAIRHLRFESALDQLRAAAGLWEARPEPADPRPPAPA